MRKLATAPGTHEHSVPVIQQKYKNRVGGKCAECGLYVEWQRESEDA